VLLTPSQTDRIEIILVSPRNPLNIGAAARAMANFGFERLSIVAPFAHNWMEAKSAVGAPQLLRDARVFETLAEAVANCHLVLGTGSLDRRKPVQQVLSLPEAAAILRNAIGVRAEQENSLEQKSTGETKRVALLFGSEKHGLTSEDLSWCHGIVAIETAEAQPSMNLGQAVAVCLYELSRIPTPLDAPSQVPDQVPGQAPGQAPDQAPNQVPDQAPNQANPFLKIKSAEHRPDSAQLDRLAELIEETMAAVNYATRGMRSANGEALRILLRRLMPNESDLRRMMGLFRRILWQLHKKS